MAAPMRCARRNTHSAFCSSGLEHSTTLPSSFITRMVGTKLCSKKFDLLRDSHSCASGRCLRTFNRASGTL